uniref:Uncharacterized protein n=1 Tax=Ananas comosus var. bracteatus TaxID=296719 RepID=A0A6V7QW26_ANACO
MRNELMFRAEFHHAMESALQVDVPKKHFRNGFPPVDRPKFVHLHLLHKVVDFVLSALAQQPIRNAAEEVSLRARKVVQKLRYDFDGIVRSFFRRGLRAFLWDDSFGDESLALWVR